ncbi:(d)CMP kinase [Thermaurantiacus sp.]
MTIAVDGPAASGKGTIARALAQHFGLSHLDTGAIYRAVALEALRAGVPLDDAGALAGLAHHLDLTLLEDPALRDPETAEAASLVSQHPGVRAALLEFQRSFATRAGGAVLDGRDIGTVILPDATAKLFVTATPEVRARRRLLELEARGHRADFDGVLALIRLRDRRDSERAAAPLVKAPDAILLDTTDLDREEAIRRAIERVSVALCNAAQGRAGRAPPPAGHFV